MVQEPKRLSLMLADAEPACSGEIAGKISLYSILCRKVCLHYQGFNTESFKRFGRAQSHAPAQDSLAVSKKIPHASVIMRGV